MSEFAQIEQDRGAMRRILIPIADCGRKDTERAERLFEAALAVVESCKDASHAPELLVWLLGYRTYLGVRLPVLFEKEENGTFQYWCEVTADSPKIDRRLLSLLGRFHRFLDPDDVLRRIPIGTRLEEEAKSLLMGSAIAA